MYSGDSNFTSDLINSYAWDTAVVFVQTFDNRTNKTKPYSRLSSLNTGSLATQGTNNLSDTTKQDKICNIWDMASNEVEWTTETGKDTGTSCSDRGGQYPSNMNYTTVRDALSKTGSYVNVAFRPIIYM